MRIAKTGPSVITYYYVTDALGSTRLVTDTTGKAVFYDNYQPYGTDNTSKGIEAYKFTGKPVSQTTGLYYYGARWYDSTIGRFISQDPLAGRRADPQSLNPYVYVENAPTSSTDPTGMADCGWNPLSWRGCAENAGGVAWNGLTTAGTDIQNGWNSLSPEEQQGIILAGLVALTFATGGTDLLVVGAVGFAIGAGGYTGITVATGGTPTLQGALFWGTVGFGAATAIASLPSIGPRVMSTLGLRGAAEATAETGFSATRSGVGTFTKLGREIGVKHADAIDMAGGYQNYLNLIKDTVENGVDTSSIETTNPAYLTLRSTTSKFFVVADPNANSIVTAFYNTPRGPLGSLWQMLLKVPA